jgi:hypothetical protein
MKHLATIALCLACAGCGTFQLDAGAVLPPGKTMDQAAIDQLICKDKAATDSQTAADQARGFLLGLTIIGVAVDLEQQKKDQRRIFAECMTARGYKVIKAAL